MASDYGTVEGVAQLSPYTRGGEFFDADEVYNIEATVPPLATVEAWLIAMSAYMNAALKDAYFTTPVTEEDYPDSFAVITKQVEMLVADLVAARNQQGRFFLQTAEATRDLTNWAKIQKELQDWVNGNVEAFLAEEIPQITTNPIRHGQTAVILQDDEFDE